MCAEENDAPILLKLNGYRSFHGCRVYFVLYCIVFSICVVAPSQFLFPQENHPCQEPCFHEAQPFSSL